MVNERRKYFVDAPYEGADVWACKARSDKEAAAMYHNLCKNKKGFSVLEFSSGLEDSKNFTNYFGLYRDYFI